MPESMLGKVQMKSEGNETHGRRAASGPASETSVQVTGCSGISRHSLFTLSFSSLGNVSITLGFT